MAKHYYYEYQDTITAILAEYNASITDANLDKAASAELLKTDYHYKPEEEKERMMRETKDSIKRNLYQAAASKVEAAQNTLRRQYKVDADKIERSRIRALTGIRLMEEYAQRHSIDLETARLELDEYAKIRKSGFTEQIADKYAAIRNRHELKGEDSYKAYRFEQSEMDKLGISETNEYVKKSEYYASQTPGQVLNEWNTSGAVISRQLETDAAR